MGEPNAALGVYMNNPNRIRSVLEYAVLGKEKVGKAAVSFRDDR